MNNNYYVSLCRGLLGYYVFIQATDEDVVRDYCVKYMGKMWCSVYNYKQIKSFVFDINIINPLSPIILNGCSDYE
jgi:hypothetical protein